MQMIDAMRSKREQFHREIRRKNQESIFSQKRVLPRNQIFEDYSQMAENDQLPDALNMVMPHVQGPMVVMVQNRLGITIIQKYFTINADWESSEKALRYVACLSQLQESDLSPYLQSADLFTKIMQYFLDVILEINQKNMLIVAGDSAITEQQKMSVRFNYLVRIICYITSDCAIERSQILMNQFLLKLIFKTLSSPMESSVLCACLEMISKMVSTLNTESTQCIRNCQFMINPMCQALKAPNNDKIIYVLIIIKHFAAVGFKEEFLNLLFKYGAAAGLIKLIGNQENILIEVLRIILEICYHSECHAQMLLNNNLLEKLRFPLEFGSNQVVNIILAIMENLLGWCSELRIDSILIDNLIKYYHIPDTQKVAYYVMCQLYICATREDLQKLNQTDLTDLIINYMKEDQQTDILVDGALAITNLVNNSHWDGLEYLSTYGKQVITELLSSREEDEQIFKSLLSII